MNILGQSLEEIAAEKLTEIPIDIFPGTPNCFSAAVAAFIMGVSEQTVMRMIQRGDLKPDKNGNIQKDDLVNYVKTHTLADMPVLDNPELLDRE
jgi:hypothetical protein